LNQLRVSGLRAALAAAVQRTGHADKADRLFDESEATIARLEEDESGDYLLRLRTLRA